MYEVAIRDDIGTWVLMQGNSQRSAARQYQVSRDTVARMLKESPEPDKRRYQRAEPRPAPVTEAVLPHIRAWLEQNEQLRPWARKQQWTAHKMWAELRRLNITVGESSVRELVRKEKRARKPAFVPLDFGPGERAEFDFGHAWVILDGHKVRLPFLAGRLRFSGAEFIEFFPAENQNAFILGQRHAFEDWGGVPQYAVYDNTSAAVKTMQKGHKRVETAAFHHFRSVYLFEAIFANPASGWEKGSVENQVGSSRRNHMVPIPEAETIEALNGDMERRCREGRQRIMAGRTETIATLLAHEQRFLRPLPEHPLEVGPVRNVLVSSTARIRFKANQYSVPTVHASQWLTLKADPFRVRLYQGREMVANHPRCYGRNQVIEDFRHYIPLLLEKPFAIPFASALKGALPPHWEAFRKELVARQDGGNREFARILQLCLTHPIAEVSAAMELAASASAYSVAAVQQLLHWAGEEDRTPQPLDAQRYPAYQLTQRPPDLTAYNQLLGVAK